MAGLLDGGWMLFVGCGWLVEKGGREALNGLNMVWLRCGSC